MDESAILGKKLHSNRKIARGEAECYLNCCKCNFFQNRTFVHVITYTSDEAVAVVLHIVHLQEWSRNNACCLLACRFFVFKFPSLNDNTLNKAQ